MPKNLQHSNFTLRRLSNVNSAAEGSNLPPRQFGDLRVPIVTNLKLLSTTPTVEALRTVLSWVTPEYPNVAIAGFNIIAEGVNGERQQRFLGTALGSPVVVDVPAAGYANVVLRVQTQLTNGLVSPAEVSPSVTVQGTGLAAQSSTSPLVLGYRETAVATTLRSDDYVLNCTSGTYSVTLPTAVGITGQQYVIKNSGSGNIGIATTSGQMIDGYASGAITLIQWERIRVVSTGSNWRIL